MVELKREEKFFVWAFRGLIVLGIVALIVFLWPGSAHADAPAPKLKPHAKPSPSPTPVPFDLVEGAQTDPPTVEAVAESPVPPAPVPSPKPTAVEKQNARPFHVDTQLGGLVTVTAEAGTAVTPTLWVNADGPLAIGNGHSLGRIGARLGLSSSPGQAINPVSVETFKSADVGIWYGYVVGHLRDVDTTVVVEGDFSSRLRGSKDQQPLDRLTRAVGVGVRFDARKSNASMTLLAGYDEASSSCPSTITCTGLHSGFAFMLYGQVPIVSGSVLFIADATLSAAASVPGLIQRRDVLRLGLVVDPVQAVKKLKGGN